MRYDGNLRGHTVVITGASSGIGRAAAQAFAREGAQLALAARGRDALEAVAAECEALGARTLIVPTDVTDALAVRELAMEAVSLFGGIDVWINNVGVGAVGRFWETPIEAHQQVIQANLLGHMHGAHAVLPGFIAQGCGMLINTISLGAWAPAPYAAAYSASKFALRGFSEALSAELSAYPHIHVCDIFPGFVDTPGMRHAANYTGATVRAMPPLVAPEAVAQAMVKVAKWPRRAVTIGGSARVVRAGHALAPRLSGWIAARGMDHHTRHGEPAPVTSGNLFAPSEPAAVSGGFREEARQRAAHRPLAPVIGGALLAGLALNWVMGRRGVAA